METKEFEWRKLFPISWYRLNKGYDFNAFIFYLDLLMWAVLILLIASLLS